MYTAYYYDSAREQVPGFDSNELSVNGKFESMITSVRTSDNLADLEPRSATEKIILIVSDYSTLNIVNYNPCPEDLN